MRFHTKSYYAHLSKIGVSKGDKIKKGKKIGRIGDVTDRIFTLKCGMIFSSDGFDFPVGKGKSNGTGLQQKTFGLSQSERVHSRPSKTKKQKPGS